MKITRDQALAVTHFCRTHNVKYASAATYPNTQAAAEKRQVRSSNGMLLHFPRDPNTRWQKENPRAYVLWYGEPLENIIEALAFIKMTTRKEELIVLRCKHASKAAEQVESTIIEPGSDTGSDTSGVFAVLSHIIDSYEREE